MRPDLKALRYLDDLAREAGSEPALLRELAAGYERIGEVQGMPEWPSEGRTGDALASFERALELERRSRAPGGAGVSGLVGVTDGGGPPVRPGAVEPGGVSGLGGTTEGGGPSARPARSAGATRGSTWTASRGSAIRPPPAPTPR